MTSKKIRQKFTNYFKKRKHKLVTSSSLWPQDDPSILLTSAGMQQFKSYFIGQKNPIKDFGVQELISVQPCFRTSDIELVGDPIHNTFFEMLGNFSIGGYFKEEAIALAWEFLTKEMNLNKNRFWATFFKGDKQVKRDSETEKIWKKYLMPDKIISFGNKDNWWGPPGKSGPAGPCSEIHFDFTDQPCIKKKECLPNCQCGRFMELWNLVFMEYHIDISKKIRKLPKKNIDTGLGLERLALIMQKKKNIFETDLFAPIVNKILADKNFGSTNNLEDIIRSRIAADHFKGSVFLLADDISFSNKEQGYILRRIFRRALDQFMHANLNLDNVVDSVINIYETEYNHLSKKRSSIIKQMNQEFESYKKVLEIDVDEIVKKITNLKKQTKRLSTKGPSSRKISAHEAFILYSSYGLSPERLKRKGFKFDENAFIKEIVKHQKLSRTGAKSKFGGHGLTSNEWPEDERKKMTRLHTATHLLHQALRDVLGKHVKQQGSDINPQRLRFDFEHPAGLTDQEKQKVEEIVNKKIIQNLPVTKTEMNYNDAIQNGALAFFKEKYPINVTVYSLGDYSKELCGGPHVKSTGEIEKFKIISEKSSSAGIRRIKATIQ